MTRYNVSKSFCWQGQLREKAGLVCRMFGLTVDKLRGRAFVHRCQLEINEGDIVYITGPSGAGKSVLLRELEKQIPEGDRINLSQIELPADRAVIDCIDGGFVESLSALNKAGLCDVYCVLNWPALLSEGQQWRFRLAAALGSGKKFVLADEFCSQLDRITAAVVAYNVRRFARQYGVTFLLASCHDDILMDLQPDVIVAKDLSGETEVIYKEYRRQTTGGKSEARNPKSETISNDRNSNEQNVSDFVH
jgi:uncharacterized protein